MLTFTRVTYDLNNNEIIGIYIREVGGYWIDFINIKVFEQNRQNKNRKDLDRVSCAYLCILCKFLL